jgi:hypothetical protein
MRNFVDSQAFTKVSATRNCRDLLRNHFYAPFNSAHSDEN